MTLIIWYVTRDKRLALLQVTVSAQDVSRLSATTARRQLQREDVTAGLQRINPSLQRWTRIRELWGVKTKDAGLQRGGCERWITPTVIGSGGCEEAFRCTAILITFYIWCNISILTGAVSSRMMTSPPYGRRAHWRQCRLDLCGVRTWDYIRPVLCGNIHICFPKEQYVKYCIITIERFKTMSICVN